jgi:large subunit ribosomal protein L7Ae
MSKELTKEQSEELLRILEVVKQNGKVKKGANEATKSLERGLAKIVILAKDVNPAELIMHLPLIAQEKSITCVTCGTKEELGAAAGLTVGTVAVAITDEGNAKADLKRFIDALN